MADYLITTDFKAHDMVIPVLKNMESKSRMYADRMQRTFSQMFKGSFMGTMGANLVTSGLNQVRMGVMNVVEDYKEFDKFVNAAAVKFGDIDYGSEKFKEIGEVAREVGRTTQFTSMDAASGLFELAGAGFAVENSLKVLPGIANFAAASKLQLAEATGVAGRALNQFALNSKDATTQAKNLEFISDKLATTDRMSMASMQGLAETATWSANEFINAGQSIETWSVMAAMLADVGKQGTLAGTTMRGMVNDLAKLSKKGYAAFKTLGIGSKEIFTDPATGGTRDYLSLLKAMEPAFKKLSDEKKTKIIGDIFGQRSRGGIIALLNDMSKADNYMDNVTNKYAGSTKVMGEQLTQSLAMRVELLSNAFTEKGFQVFEKFLTDGAGGIESMIDAVNKFDVDPIANGLKQIGSALAFLARHTDDLIRIGKAFVMIKGSLLLMEKSRMIGSFLGGGMGGMGGLTAGLGQIVRSGGAVPAAMPFMMPTPAQMGAGGMVPATVTKPRYTGRYDNWGQPATIKTANKLNIDSVMNVAFAAGTAGVIGYQLGGMFNDNFIEPTRKLIEDIQGKQSNFLATAGDQLKKGATVEQLQKMQSQAKIEKTYLEEAPVMVNPEDFIQLAHSFFSGDVLSPFEERQKELSQWNKLSQLADRELKKYEDARSAQERYIKEMEAGAQFNFGEVWAPMEDYSGKQQEVNALYDIYLGHLQDLNESTREAAVQGGQAVVTVHVEGPGAGNVTTKTSTKGPRAPSVDVSRGGPN